MDNGGESLVTQLRDRLSTVGDEPVEISFTYHSRDTSIESVERDFDLRAQLTGVNLVMVSFTHGVWPLRRIETETIVIGLVSELLTFLTGAP